jgi:hypothetical protein
LKLKKKLVIRLIMAKLAAKHLLAPLAHHVVLKVVPKIAARVGKVVLEEVVKVVPKERLGSAPLEVEEGRIESTMMIVTITTTMMMKSTQEGKR